MEGLTCRELTPDRLADYLDFFEARAFSDNPRWAGCYCFFPLHDPEKTDWQQRSAAENRGAVTECVVGGRAQGYLAYANGRVVGWCSAGPWSQYPMLRDFPETDTESLGVIFCFVVAPDWRGKGVATTLLDAACDGLRNQGLKAVQAKPVKNAATAAANHFGPLSMYLAAGFRIIREADDGDVFVRKSLVAS